MKIVLDHVMPAPLAEINHAADSVWGNYTELPEAKKILLNASSGKGKSTFTLTTIGLRKDYQGTVTYDGISIRDFNYHDWTRIRKEKIAVVFQDLQLFPHLSVGENLLLKNSLTGVFSEKEIHEMLEKLEIDNKWGQYCGLLSLGQQQRVAIIRALCQPFEFLLMDEPFSHLDDENSQRSLNLINERCDAIGAGFVLTTLGDNHQFNYDVELKL